MDRFGNVSATDILRDIQTDLSKEGWEPGRINGSDGSRFAFMYVTLPNGQEFKVQVEEVV